MKPVADSLSRIPQRGMDGLLLAFAADLPLAERLAELVEAAGYPSEREERLVVFGVPVKQRRALVHYLRQRFTPVQRKLIRIGPGLLPHLFAAPDLDTYAEILETEWFDSAFASKQFVIYYQPIVDVTIGRAIAYECLIRLEADRIYNGGEIINAASIRGQIVQFDAFARVHTIRTAKAQHQPGLKIFLNFFPSAVYDPAACLEATIAATHEMGFVPADLVFEIIECDPITNPAHTLAICQFLRSRGFKFAIDDLGIGASTLEMILKLAPDYIKVDKSIIWGLQDPAKQDFLRRAVALAANIGAEVIAEGIETIHQAREAREYGIRLMQGYGFGKPSPVMAFQSALLANRELTNLSGALRDANPVTASSDCPPELAPASAANTPRIPL